jgi:hypothetical protein|tara:strand:- start:1095 stop:1523 length:429 start_codon:yes stop_codon:yes gene_type:complete
MKKISEILALSLAEHAFKNTDKGMVQYTPEVMEEVLDIARRMIDDEYEMFDEFLTFPRLKQKWMYETMHPCCKITAQIIYDDIRQEMKNRVNRAKEMLKQVPNSEEKMLLKAKISHFESFYFPTPPNPTKSKEDVTEDKESP